MSKHIPERALGWETDPHAGTCSDPSASFPGSGQGSQLEPKVTGAWKHLSLLSWAQLLLGQAVPLNPSNGRATVSKTDRG